MELSNDESGILIKQPSHEMAKYISQKDPLEDHSSFNYSSVNLGKYPKEIMRVTFNKDQSTQTQKNPNLGNIEEKVFEIKRDLMIIEQLIGQCDDIQRREMLLDRGMVLSSYLNDIAKAYNITINDLKKINSKYMGMNTKVSNSSVNNNSLNKSKFQINPELLNQKYWTEKKIDRYEETEERKKIPQEFWYNLKGHNFSRELHKGFDLANGDFKSNYKWLFNVQ